MRGILEFHRREEDMDHSIKGGIENIVREDQEWKIRGPMQRHTAVKMNKVKWITVIPEHLHMPRINKGIVHLIMKILFKIEKMLSSVEHKRRFFLYSVHFFQCNES